jgi:PAS domain S-box-containing protein
MSMVNRKKILLADDSKTQCLKIQSILEKEGYIVKTVSNGLKAMDYLKVETDLPDIILTDIFMPEMDGFELCVEIKKTFPVIPVIIFTVHNDEKNLQKAFESGASDYLAKPYTKTELILRVTNVLLMSDSEKLMTNMLSELKSNQKELEKQNKAYRELQVESTRIQNSFNNVFNNSDDAMLIISGNNFIDCNKATVKLLKGKNKKDVCSTHPSQLSPPVQSDGRDSFEKANEMMDLAYKKGVHRFEWMHRKLTGEVFPVEVTLIPIEYQNELVLHTLWKDLTEKKAKEKLLDEANKKLIQSNNKLETAIQSIRKKAKAIENSAKLKSSFLATMSHEIRTPLNVIMGSTQLLKNSDSQEEKKQYTNIIETSGNLLLGLVNNVLDYSRIEAHKLKILDNEFYLDNIINGLNEILNESAENKKLKFIIQTDHNLSELLIGDDIRLQQVLLNLCNNAIKYTKKGSVLLKIETLKETVTEINYKFSVIDTGIGISEEDIKQLFKPFSQFDPEANKDIEGTGLGLSIVKGTVDLMGGKVGVDSKVGIGSTFWVKLKFKKQTLNVKKRRKDDSIRDHFNTEKSCLKILIADDYKFSSIILEKILQKSNITSIDTAEDGQEVIDLFKVNDYDIIFMDCNMPVMNGFDATKEIRKLKKTTYIVALSADVMYENEKACINAGMDYFIVKPFKAVEIDNIIREIILTKITPTD